MLACHLTGVGLAQHLLTHVNYKISFNLIGLVKIFQEIP